MANVEAPGVPVQKGSRTLPLFLPTFMWAEIRAELWRTYGGDLLALDLLGTFPGHPQRQDPLRILRFCDPHFQIFGAARHNFIKKKVAALGKTRGLRHS